MARLIEVITMYIENQNPYGERKKIEPVFKYFKHKFDGKYNVDQVIFALDTYTDNFDDFPTYSKLIKILNPPPHLISESEYVQACKWQENNGYPMFSDAKDIKDAYKKQNEHKRAEIISQSNKVQELVGNISKQLTNRN